MDRGTVLVAQLRHQTQRAADMRILFIGRNAKIGGGTTYLRNLIPALQQRSCHCQLMTRGGPALPILKQVVDHTWWLPPVSWWAAARAEKIIRNQKIDVVNALTTNAAQHLLAACQGTGVPLIMTILSRTRLARCLPAADYAHAISATNSGTLNFLKDNYPELAGKLYLSSKPLPRPRRVQPHTSAADAITVTYMARLTRTKGPCALDLIEAWPRLVNLVGNLKLVIVGDGRLLRQTRRKAAQVNKELALPHIQVPGGTLNPEPVFENTDILLGAGYTALQGLAWGCTVIGMGYAGLFGLLTPENIEEAIRANFGDTGAQWPQVDSQLLADQIVAASQQLTEPDDWIESVFDQHFNPSRIAEDLESLFEEAIHNK